ncbi:hypothetical protein [Streptomyces sp. NPDC019937]|uniref:hypothetical protein n=1 Tax=Streptomyces sp. NPDC019937 TaxID=3154787 RepID=UPI0033D4C0BE
MEIAKLVLEFLKVLVWPAVTLFVLVFFRAETRDLFQRLRSLRGGIAEAEFAEQAAQAREESELAVAGAAPSTDVVLPFRDELLSAARSKPEGAVRQAWQTLERQLEDVVFALGLKRRARGHIGPLNVDYVASRLVALGLPQSAGSALVDLRRARAQIYELGASSEGARDFIEACNNIYRQVAEFLASQEKAA